MQAQLSLDLDLPKPLIYTQRGTNALQMIFKEHFDRFAEIYDTKYAKIYGRFRIDRISEVVHNFIWCGDYTQGVARIQCTNPDCREEFFRPFSCKGFYLCPSCSQKRSLLFSEYMDEQLLLRLPHRQFVWTFPKILRPFFRHDRRLFSEISRLLFKMLADFYNEAAGKAIESAAVLVFQTAGDFVRHNPHYHGIVLEGGFDDQGRFIHVPLGDLSRMSEYFRRMIIKFFLAKKLIAEKMAQNLLSWRHSGFSIDNQVKIPAFGQKAREALSQYIAKPPVSLKKVLFEQHDGRVIYYSDYNNYFKRNMQVFTVHDFIASVTQHIPARGLQYIRRYGLYSSRGRGKWVDKPYVVRLAPAGWKDKHSVSDQTENLPGEQEADIDVASAESRASWARLIRKIYEVDPLVCKRCGSPMKVLAVITDPDEVKNILKHLMKTGKSPPGLDPSSLRLD